MTGDDLHVSTRAIYFTRWPDRERDRRRTAWHRLNCHFELSTCSAWGTWRTCVYLVNTRSTRNEACQLSQFFVTTKGLDQGKELSHKCSTLAIAWKTSCCCSSYCLSRISLLDKTKNWRQRVLCISI